MRRNRFGILGLEFRIERHRGVSIFQSVTRQPANPQLATGEARNPQSTIAVASQHGFTLIEMLLAVLVLSMVAGLTAPMLLNGFHIWQQGQQSSDVTHDLRSVMDWISTDLRDADRILSATSEHIELDLTGKTIHYALEAGTLNTWQNGTEHRPLASDVSQLRFIYFDSNGNALPASNPMDSSLIAQIRRVQIQLAMVEPGGEIRDAQTSVYRQQGRYVLLKEGYSPEHALLCNGGIDIQGYATVTGTLAHLYTNQSLTWQADEGSFIQGNVSAVGSIVLTGAPLILGETLQGQPPFPLPDIVATRYRSWADVILAMDGTAQTQSGHIIATGSYGGWIWEDAVWKQVDTHPWDGTYYLETEGLIQGSEDASLWRTTVISPHAVRVEGKNHLQSHRNGLLLLSGSTMTLVTGESEDERMTCSGHLLSSGDFAAQGDIQIQGSIIVAGESQIRGPFTLDSNPTSEKLFPDLFALIEHWQRVGE